MAQTINQMISVLLPGCSYDLKFSQLRMDSGIALDDEEQLENYAQTVATANSLTYTIDWLRELAIFTKG